MNIFFDFDDVLFHTKRFGEDFKQVFFKHGVSEECFTQTYEDSRKSTAIPNYNFDRQLVLLSSNYGIDEVTLRADLDVFLADTSMYVFDDMIGILEKLRAAGNGLFLVSYGAPQSWQEGKVFRSGVAPFFDRCVIGEIAKGIEALKIVNDFPSSKNYFIDDRCSYLEDVKKDAPNVTTILFRRPEGRYTDDASEACDITAESADEILQILEDAR